MKHRFHILRPSSAALFLLCFQLALIFLSWLYSAAFPSSEVRSLLSGEGLRFLLGGYAGMMASPVLVWLLLFFIAYGITKDSRMLHRPGTFLERRAAYLSAILLCVIIAVVLLLSVVPHAILLSATGRIWPSPFSAALPTMLCSSMILLSAVYGFVSGVFRAADDVYNSAVHGLSAGAPFLLFYLLLGQIWQSVCFIMGLPR